MTTTRTTAPAAYDVTASGPPRRRRYLVSGVVQGVGFRPFVYAAATDLGLTGTVANCAAGVSVDAEGSRAALDELRRRIREEPPPLALVVGVATEELEPRGGTGFVIESSGPTGRSRTWCAADVTTCADCVHDLTDPDDRRFRHPFVTCTNCGPRFTITAALPYDRESTTMADFVMCAACRREYDDPGSRRFDAQPISCHDCGPVLHLVEPGLQSLTREAALREARSVLRSGRVLAVKGIGGYHLVCDASSESAVLELRRRKGRAAKPFALMVSDVAAAREIVRIDADELVLLTGPQRPIVLLARRPEAGAGMVAGSVAPGAPDLGVMLPYTPLHELLLGLDGNEPGPRILVMTSGNLGGEPIITDDEALERLTGLADAWLGHDRRIVAPCDDSVVRVIDGTAVTLRRSRGYAPLPIALPVDVPPMLAVGADLKSVCCLAEGRFAWLSQHIGDMDDLDTVAAFAWSSRGSRNSPGSARACSPSTSTRATAACDGRRSTQATAWW